MARNVTGSRQHKSVGKNGTRRKTTAKTTRASVKCKVRKVKVAEERRAGQDRRLSDVPVEIDLRQCDRRQGEHVTRPRRIGVDETRDGKILSQG